jgi:hypothetical protein
MKLFNFAIFAFCLLTSNHIITQNADLGKVVAVPEAEGFGRYATGERSGKVYHVTTLEDGDYEGTFRHAVLQKGTRMVVFDVTGTIFLNSNLNIVNGNLTIAGQTASGQGCYGGEGVKVNIVNNYYNPGHATPKDDRVSYRIAAIGVRTTAYVTGRNGQPNGWKPMEHVWGKFYVDGNFVEGNEEVTKDNWTKGMYEQIDKKANDNTFTEQVKKEIRLDAPLETDAVTTHSAGQAYQLVLKYAGCSEQRDIIDARIVKETKKGIATYYGSITEDAKTKPGLIDIPDDVKPTGTASPWLELSNRNVHPDFIKDSDDDGIPDYWEIKHNLNLYDISDDNAITL